MASIQIQDANRLETKAEEYRIQLLQFRGALERISESLGMSESPDLTSDVPREVEKRLGASKVRKLRIART